MVYNDTSFRNKTVRLLIIDTYNRAAILNTGACRSATSLNFLL